jgi:hypothetical protein
MIRRVKESVSSVTSKGYGVVVRFGKAPKTAKLKDGQEKGLKDIENVKALSFEFTAMEKDVFERNKFAEGKKQ